METKQGKHHVKRNFKVEEDLSPRWFAPDIGNTPDMELYNKDFVIISEVSLQSGVSQWITEGSSVTDHVYKFILECYYSKDIPATKSKNLLYNIHMYAHQVNHFQEWLEGISILIEEHLQRICDIL